MKELFTAFNTDFFRALATLVIPGSIAVSTWSIELILIFELLRRLVERNRVERAFVLFVAVVCIGMVIEDIGSRIESWFDKRVDRITQGRHTEEWYTYLKTAFVCEYRWVTSEDFARQRLRPVASGCASNSVPQKE
jgi:hypothetical protein